MTCTAKAKLTSVYSLNVDHGARQIISLMRHGYTAYSLDTFIHGPLADSKVVDTPYRRLVDEDQDAPNVKTLNSSRIGRGMDPNGRKQCTRPRRGASIDWLKSRRKGAVPVFQRLQQLLTLVNARVQVILFLICSKVYASSRNVHDTQRQLVRSQVHQAFGGPPYRQDAAPLAESNPRVLTQPLPPGRSPQRVSAFAVVVLASLDPKDATKVPLPRPVAVLALRVPHFICADENRRGDDFPGFGVGLVEEVLGEVVQGFVVVLRGNLDERSVQEVLAGGIRVDRVLEIELVELRLAQERHVACGDGKQGF